MEQNNKAEQIPNCIFLLLQITLKPDKFGFCLKNSNHYFISVTTIGRSLTISLTWFLLWLCIKWRWNEEFAHVSLLFVELSSMLWKEIARTLIRSIYRSVVVSEVCAHSRARFGFSLAQVALILFETIPKKILIISQMNFN